MLNVVVQKHRRMAFRKDGTRSKPDDKDVWFLQTTNVVEMGQAETIDIGRDVAYMINFRKCDIYLQWLVSEILIFVSVICPITCVCELFN